MVVMYELILRFGMLFSRGLEVIRRRRTSPSYFWAVLHERNISWASAIRVIGIRRCRRCCCRRRIG